MRIPHLDGPAYDLIEGRYYGEGANAGLGSSPWVARELAMRVAKRIKKEADDAEKRRRTTAREE